VGELVQDDHHDGEHHERGPVRESAVRGEVRDELREPGGRDRTDGGDGQRCRGGTVS
jgi:hypothetical protein